VVALRERGAEIQIISAQDNHLNLSAVLKRLGEWNILSVLLECGSHLNGAFLNADLVDKAVLFYSTSELGPQSLSFAEGIASPFLFEQSLRRTSRAAFGADSCVTGYLHDPWPVSLI
jgi:diaminohydroxyphosphoribosylaminopyrimidine deaminase/5-amino-6-(5-phosphoribosylamino)uracil reductase